MRAPSVSAGFCLALVVLLTGAQAAEAQGRGRGGGEPAPSVSAELTISLGDRDAIRQFYAERPAQGVEGLPPGIRRNLERGKPLPPGIAKRNPPAELRSRLSVREGFEIVEVGLDVFLVEVATNVIHDVLMDVIR
jgi:hypothetical protein